MVLPTWPSRATPTTPPATARASPTPAGTQAYTYPSTNHRLTQVGATARSYDNAGNTTAIGGTAKEFVYDDTGRMSQVKQNAIVQRNYAYNGKGEQVRKYLGRRQHLHGLR